MTVAVAVANPVFLSDGSFGVACPTSLFVYKWSRPAFSSEYLLASLRNLSANDNELALSMSSSDRLWMAVFPFLSSSVMPNPYMQSLCIWFDCSTSADNLDDNVWLLLSPVAALLNLVGDTFIDSISKSVFLFAVDEGVDDITAGIFMVTDVVDDEDDDEVDDDDDGEEELNAADRLFGSTNVTDVTISSSSMVLIVALVAVSLAVTLGVVVFPFCTHFICMLLVSNVISI